MERHNELREYVEKMERLRVGAATSMMMSAWVAKKDGSDWEPADVFPDLRPPEPTEAENAEGILQMFRMMATRVH